jgi:hypothetical protein
MLPRDTHRDASHLIPSVLISSDPVEPANLSFHSICSLSCKIRSAKRCVAKAIGVDERLAVPFVVAVRRLDCLVKRAASRGRCSVSTPMPMTAARLIVCNLSLQANKKREIISDCSYCIKGIGSHQTIQKACRKADSEIDTYSVFSFIL